MTYNPFDALDPYSDKYNTNDSFGPGNDANTPNKSFDRNDPFAHLDPLLGKPVKVEEPLAQPEVVAPVELENDSPNSSVADFILRDEDSFAGRVNRGIAERASSIGGGLVRFVGQSADELGDWLEEKVPLGVIDIGTDGISWRPSTEEDIAQPSFLLPLAETMEGADFGYKEGTTWEDVKSEPLSNVLPWALETGLVSVPDMAASILALPAYIAARTGEIGQNRAENKGETDATFQEFLEVLPVSVGASLLERFGTGKVFGINTPISTLADAPKEVIKRGATEGIVEGIQEPAEYAAETIGTNVEFKPEVALERSLQGLISGGVTGGTLAPLTMPGELALADTKKSDGGPQNTGNGGPQANPDGSFGTPNPALADPNAFAVTDDGTVVYEEGTAPDATGTTPDLPTSEAPDIAEVEVGINAQRAALDDDLAKALASLDAPLTSSVPPTPEVIAPQIEVDPLSITADDVPQLEPDALTITADDMAQMDLDAVEDQAQIDKDIAAYEASIAATNTELAPELQELAPELPVAPVKKKLVPLSQIPENAAQTKKVDPKLVDPTKDDLLTAIAKIGGITRTEAASEGFDPADFQMRRGGLKPVFRLKEDLAVSIDSARETLAQSGYIDADSTVNDFVDLLQKAVRGETVVSTSNEAYLEVNDAARTEDYIAQDGEKQGAPAVAEDSDQTITSALEEARTIGLPETEIDSILTNYPKESDAVLQLQMSMAGVEIGDSSGASNQAARLGDLRPERTVQQGEGDRGLAGSSTDVPTGSSNNESQNVTDEVGVLLSPSVTSGDTIADSEAGSGGGIDNAGLSGTIRNDNPSLGGDSAFDLETQTEATTPSQTIASITPKQYAAKQIRSLAKEYGVSLKLSEGDFDFNAANKEWYDAVVQEINNGTTITAKQLDIAHETFDQQSFDQLFRKAADNDVAPAGYVNPDARKTAAKEKADYKATSFDLETQTEASLAADTELATIASTELAAKTKTLSNRAKADAEVGSFLLTGSDAAADVAAANGQDDMFDADSNGTGQDSGKPLFSKSAILAPDAKPKGVTEAQIQARVDVFLAKYKGADDVRVWVRDTQDNAFGPGSTAKDDRIKGGYYPEQDAVVFIAENIDSVQDIDSTIQHELLVHKGLGLFEAKDVQGLIDVINSNATKSKALKNIWLEVKDKYKEKSPEVQAEELLARVAEKKMSKPDKYWNKIVTFIRDMLRKIGFVKEISFSDLRKRVYDMGDAFAEGRRAETRQGFEANTEQTKSPSSDGLSGSKRFDSKKDKDTVRPNPSMIDMSKRPDKKVTSKTSDTLGFTTNDKNVSAKIPKVEKGNGKPDITIYGKTAGGQRALVAKPRAGGWDIIVDRRADGELFTDGKPREYTGQTRKQVEERVKMLGLELEEVRNKKPPNLPPIEGELLNDQPEWAMKDATWFEEKIFQWQDRNIAADKARKAIEEFNGERLADDMRVYEVETLGHGKAAAQLDTFYEKTLTPLQKLLSKNDLSMDEVSDYLYARHTREANAAMKEKDGDRTENEALSGRTNEWADKTLADFKAAGKMDALKEIAQVTDGIIERTRKLLVRTGLESESTVQGWRDQYEFYSPLWGDPSDPEGTKRREDESKKRFGRRSRADNVYINLIVQHEQTFVRAERNYLHRSLLKMAQENPNQDFFTINKPETKRLQDPVTELFMDKEIAPSEFPSNVVPVTVDGEKFLIQFNDDNFHSSMFAHVMNTAAGSDITGWLKLSHLTSRWVSTINTQFNLEFLPNNFMKDFQTALINLHQYADLSGAQIAKIAGNVRVSIKGIRDHQKGNTDTEMAVWYERFKNAGAQTGWLDNYDSMAERGRALQTMINRDKHVSLDAAHRLVEYVSDMNTAYENGIRLSSFKVLVGELGFTEQRAAFAVKNLTVNFNQKGEKSITANALYVFFKSSMNGTANIAKAVQSKRVRKMLYKVLGFTIGLNVLNQLLSGEDEDGQSAYSKIPLYIRDNHYIFMFPDIFGSNDVSDRYYFSAPLSYGYNVVPVAGNIIAGHISSLLGSQDYQKGDSFSRMLGAFIHGYNPVGSTGGLAQFISPTITDTLAQIFENKNFAGNPISQEQMPFGPPVPNSQLSYRNTPQLFKDTATWLNDISGGDEVRPGNIDVSPEWIQEYFGFFTGGTGRFLGDLVGTPVKALLGEEWSVKDVPFLRKVIKQVGSSTDRNNFHAALDDIEYAIRAKKAAKESGDDDKIDQVEEEYGHLIGLERAAKGSRNQVSKWKDEIKLFEDDEDESNEYKQSMIKDLNKEIRSEMMMFVREYYDAVELAEDY